jgi:hypothetical protein
MDEESGVFVALETTRLDLRFKKVRKMSVIRPMKIMSGKKSSMADI